MKYRFQMFVQRRKAVNMLLFKPKELIWQPIWLRNKARTISSVASGLNVYWIDAVLSGMKILVAILGTIGIVLVFGEFQAFIRTALPWIIGLQFLGWPVTRWAHTTSPGTSLALALGIEVVDFLLAASFSTTVGILLGFLALGIVH